MSATQFDRDSLARTYALAHLTTDPGLVEVCYLPLNADEREIRFAEVNALLGERTDDALEPIDLGIDRGTETEQRLVFLDVTPAQWERIQAGELSLPQGWSLEGAIRYDHE